MTGLCERPSTTVEVGSAALGSAETAETSLASVHSGAFAVIAARLLDILEKGSVERYAKVQQKVTSQTKSAILRLLTFSETHNFTTKYLAEEICNGGLVKRTLAA